MKKYFPEYWHECQWCGAKRKTTSRGQIPCFKCERTTKYNQCKTPEIQEVAEWDTYLLKKEKK